MAKAKTKKELERIMRAMIDVMEAVGVEDDDEVMVDAKDALGMETEYDNVWLRIRIPTVMLPAKQSFIYDDDFDWSKVDVTVKMFGKEYKIDKDDMREY